jgi:LPXTG-motif cell wall-anchored protein
MKLTKLTIKLFFVFLFISLPVIKVLAQETSVKPSIDKGSIESRFDYIIREATALEDSKVVKGWWIYRLKSSVSDTLKALHSEILETKRILSVKNSEIDSLKSGMQFVKDQLNTVNNEKNSIGFMGINMSKTGYNSLMWFIIIGLAVLLIIFIALFKRSNIVTSQTKTDLRELKDEFEAFRKRALEREEKIVRKYHDELSKYKGTDR